MRGLSDEDLERLKPAEQVEPRTPLPVRMVSSEEYRPVPQSAKQRETEARLYEIADGIAPKLGLSRRRFFQTSAGTAAGFAALNGAFGPIFAVGEAEANTPELADERAQALAGQFIMDMHTHFLRDDTRLTHFVRMRESVAAQGWNPQLEEGAQTIEALKFENYFKEVFLDSDTKIALISSAPSEIPEDWFLTNRQMAAARATVNGQAGSKRMMTHAIITPESPGWLDDLDAALELRPDSLKGYTVGDNTHKELARHPWRMDSRETYRGYEKALAAGVTNICVHKGLWGRGLDDRFPILAPYARVDDVAQAAKDWPQLNFVIYHAAYRLDDPEWALAEFERTGRIDWVTDLAEIPEKHGVSNVYADLGQIFAQTLVAQPRICAAIMGQLVKGLGADHVCWGTDAVWTGSPQWQIEGLRRLEIPEDMQRAHGFAPLGAADGPVKTAIFGGNNARLYGVEPLETAAALERDRFAALKRAYVARGATPSNRRYGYVARG
ncbi:amidohydrolase family protein [Sphingosinithalassobacter sp. CS137]|uniref:amidohydrolase family protein n=1 Tax=Sphingosinithalassobacter sp. CS137 TaxID=2762748 RepID=UPI00165E90C8|nr:amidohydrolase family protein [Sphingosinithalassobacter sp. CS137]